MRRLHFLFFFQELSLKLLVYKGICTLKQGVEFFTADGVNFLFLLVQFPVCPRNEYREKNAYLKKSLNLLGRQ